VPKHARRIEGFDEAIVSLYAKDLTTGEIHPVPLEYWVRVLTCDSGRSESGHFVGTPDLHTPTDLCRTEIGSGR
jgi:hypothetical protein